MKDSTITLESMEKAVWYNRWMFKQFTAEIKDNILEVGCGIGTFTKELLPLGKVTAIEIEKDYLTKVSQALGSEVSVGYGDIEKGEYFFSGKGEQFDTIICLNVLEHIKNDTVALTNMHKLLTETGTLILVVPSNPSLYGEIDRSIDHYRRYDKIAMIELLSTIGFTQVKARRFNLLGGIGWWFAGKISKDKSVTHWKIQFFNLIAPLCLPLEKLFEPPIGTSLLVIAKKK